jgi:hypothetical protein
VARPKFEMRMGGEKILMVRFGSIWFDSLIVSAGPPTPRLPAVGRSCPRLPAVDCKCTQGLEIFRGSRCRWAEDAKCNCNCNTEPLPNHGRTGKWPRGSVTVTCNMNLDQACEEPIELEVEGCR